MLIVSHYIRIYAISVAAVLSLLLGGLATGCKSGDSKTADFSDSVAYYTQLAKDMPDEPVIFYNRGIYEFRLGKYQEALSDFSNAIRIHPGFYAAYLPRGDCQRLMGNDAEAVANYDTFLVNTGGNAYLYRMRAWCQFRLKNYPQAVSDYSKLILLGSNDGMTYGQRGRSRYYAKDYAAAAEDLNKAVKLAPDSAVLYLWLANTEFKLGQWNESIGNYISAVKKKVNVGGEENFMAQAYFERAKAVREDDPGQAMKDINECLALDSVNAEAFFIRGMIIYDQGDVESACADLRTAGMLGYVEAFDEMKTCCGTGK